MKLIRNLIYVFCLCVYFATPLVAEGSDGVENYVVEAGDSLYAISRTCGADIELIAAMNDIGSDSTIYVGQTLVLPKDPEIEVIVEAGDTLWQIAKANSIDIDYLCGYNNLSQTAVLAIGSVILVPSPNLAEEPDSISVVAAINNTSYTVSRNEVSLTTSSRSGEVSVISYTVANEWLMPTIGTISSDYGERDSGFHHGIDIAADTGTPIYASCSGYVSLAGYKNYIYGYTVEIEHSGDYQTMYAHMSAVAVDEGDWVKAGDLIGYVGETGNATGPHLHFQVELNGVILDPNDFIDF